MKKWYRSKTLWFNAIVASLTALEGVFQYTKPFFGVEGYAVALITITMVNAMLRIITTQGVQFRAPKS